jgi:hypothetical protein
MTHTPTSNANAMRNPLCVFILTSSLPHCISAVVQPYQKKIKDR